MVACPGHVLESTNEIEIKLSAHIDANERECNRTIILPYILLELSFLFFIKGSLSCLGVQVVLDYNFCLT